MKRIKIFIIILIITQLVTMGFLIKNTNKKNTVSDFISFDKERKQYIIRNDTSGDVMIAILLNDNNTLYQCYINNETGTEISMLFLDNSTKTIAIKDDNFSFFSTQYINPSDEIVLDRQETTKFFSRHSQFLKDGTIQQRNWNHDKQEWEIEVPFNGEWKYYPPFMDTQ